MRLGTGTAISKGWDVRKIAEAVASPGIDTRFWISMGIVATVSEAGEIDDADASAVFIAPEGVEADVVLLPSTDHVTCRVPSGGSGATFDSPLRPGDEVLVAIPDGLPGTAPVIVGVLNSAADRLPLGPDRKPLFQNDRVLIWAGDVPIDLRAGAGRVLVNPDGTIMLGGPEATQQLVWGTSYRAAEVPAMQALQAWVTAVSAAVAADGGIAPPLKAAVAAASAALTPLMSTFNGSDYLSQTTRTK